MIATGVRPRSLDLPGADDPRVVAYDVALSGKAEIGELVAIIGAGGIGHDVALRSPIPITPRPPTRPRSRIAGASTARRIPRPPAPGDADRALAGPVRALARQEHGLDPAPGAAGFRRAAAGGRRVRAIDREGLHVAIEGRERCIAFDTLVVCAGQVPDRSLPTRRRRGAVHLIGGAKLAVELDAKRAIEDGTALGCAI